MLAALEGEGFADVMFDASALFDVVDDAAARMVTIDIRNDGMFVEGDDEEVSCTVPPGWMPRTITLTRNYLADALGPFSDTSTATLRVASAASKPLSNRGGKHSGDATHRDTDRPGGSAMIRTLDDVVLVPTRVRTVTMTRNGDVGKTREELRAQLFTELEGKPVTAVCVNIGGDPFREIAGLSRAMIGPRAGGGWSPWRLSLSLREKGKRSDIDLNRDFPVEPVILLRGEHKLDFSEITRPPLTAGSTLRWHCASFAGVWIMVSVYCARVGEVLLDTTAAAIKYQQARSV